MPLPYITEKMKYKDKYSTDSNLQTWTTSLHLSISVSIWSFMYCHMINVATTLDPKYEVKHHGISCV